MISSNNVGAAKISIDNSEDNKFEAELRKIGYGRKFQKFEAENLPNELIDEYIRSQLLKGKPDSDTED